MIGSSGTIINLAEIAEKAFRSNENPAEKTLSYRDLKKVIALLCALPLEERRKIPGINPERADIIIAGAAILDTFMKESVNPRNYDHVTRAPGRLACRLPLASR